MIGKRTCSAGDSLGGLSFGYIARLLTKPGFRMNGSLHPAFELSWPLQAPLFSGMVLMLRSTQIGPYRPAIANFRQPQLWILTLSLKD